MPQPGSLADALSGIPDDVFNGQVDGDAADALAGTQGADDGGAADQGAEGGDVDPADQGESQGQQGAEGGDVDPANQGAEGEQGAGSTTPTVDPRLTAMLEAAPEMADATPEQIASMIGMVNRLFSGTPEEVLDLFENHFEKIRQSAMLEAGRTLPPDIAKKVEDGLITEEDGRAWAQDRAAARSSTVAAQNTSQEAMVSAAQTWAVAKKVADPDFDHKAMLVENFVSAQIARGKKPKNAAEAVALYEQGYGAVNAQLRQFLPKPAPRREPTSDGQRPNTQAAPPASLADAMSRLNF